MTAEIATRVEAFDDGLLPKLDQDLVDRWEFFSAETLERFQQRALERGHALTQTFCALIQSYRVALAKLRQAELRIHTLEAGLKATAAHVRTIETLSANERHELLTSVHEIAVDAVQICEAALTSEQTLGAVHEPRPPWLNECGVDGQPWPCEAIRARRAP